MEKIQFMVQKILNDTDTNADKLRIVYAKDLLLKITVTLLNPPSREEA
jgi:hypothetical protein